MRCDRAALVMMVLLASASPGLAQRQPRTMSPSSSEPPQIARPEPKEMPAYAGRYYIIHSDLDQDAVREADLRMSRMAEEYAARTRDFAGKIRTRLPFYLFRNPADYYAAGGLAGSAGCFDGSKLMAIAGGDQQTALETWHTVQHEGFHQFATAVIGGQLPIWVNEGLAEYFGESVFTGDTFVSGVVPEWRRQRIVKTFKSAGDDGADGGIGAFMPMHDILYLSHEDWNESISITNYDQAWSMVYFLVHADGGRYQKPFAKFLRAVGAGQEWEEAWRQNIGPADGFEERWRDFWLKLPANPTDELYAQASVRTLTLFLARSVGQGQSFDDFPAFVRAADAGRIELADRDWLPQSVLLSALSEAARLHQEGYRYSLRRSDSPARGATSLPQIICQPPAGAEIVGRFTLNGNGVARIFVDSPRPFASPATGARQTSGLAR